MSLNGRALAPRLDPVRTMLACVTSPWLHWTFQIAVVFAIATWIAVDPAFPAHEMSGRFRWVPSSGSGLLLIVILLTAIADMAYLTMSLFVGSLRFRRLGSLFALVTVIGLWLGLVTAHKEIAWQGQRYRLAAHLPELEEIAQGLRTGWPDRDGVHPRLGPFMAYPFRDPSTLLLLKPPRMDGHPTSVSAIEKGKTGSLRFQLAGPELGESPKGLWIEWHPSGRPRSFVGGLQDRHRLDRYASVQDRWHLVRYDQ